MTSDLERLLALAAGTLQRFSLAGKVALVVGGNKGLGQAMALALAAAGADVTVAGRGPAGLAETAEAITCLGRRGLGLAADATDESQVERLVGETMKAFGRIDILVNSQGTVHLQTAVEFDTSAWQRVMDVNVKSVFVASMWGG